MGAHSKIYSKGTENALRPSPPAVQVVGFHVDGATPSPEQESLLNDDVPFAASSPTPVIIPPSFQVR